MDICPLPQSSCYVTSSCFLQISSSQSLRSQPYCCLPCLALLTKYCFLAGFCWFLHPWRLPASPPVLKSHCSLALPCHAPNVYWFFGLPPAGSSSLLPSSPLTFNVTMLTQRFLPTSPAELMKLRSILFSLWLICAVTLPHRSTAINLLLQEWTQ